jgi:UDP-glucuronate 4-epimerase
MGFIAVIENYLGIKAQKNMMPLQPGDVLETCADVTGLQQAVGFQPTTPLEVGLPRFIDWYKDYYQIQDFPLSA